MISEKFNVHILGILALQSPLRGREIGLRLNERLERLTGTNPDVSVGTLYAELEKLEDKGDIESSQGDGDLYFSITDAGRGHRIPIASNIVGKPSESAILKPIRS